MERKEDSRFFAAVWGCIGPGLDGGPDRIVPVGRDPDGFPGEGGVNFRGGS